MPYDVSNMTAGDEISSTYEGRHLTLYESQLVHPVHADVFVNKGDPVIIGASIEGSLVGVAFKDAAAITDLIAVDTEGIWALSCVAEDYSGNSAIILSDRLYINPADGLISKNSNHVPFGYALSTLQAGYTGLVAVKVHAGTTEAQ